MQQDLESEDLGWCFRDVCHGGVTGTYARHRFKDYRLVKTLDGDTWAWGVSHIMAQGTGA